MTSIQIGLAGLAGLVFLLSLRMPIGLTLVAISFFGISALVGPQVAFRMLASSPFQFSAAWTLSSVPMFLLMGFVCHQAGMTEGLFRLARIALARLPGGLACAGVAGAAGFASVSGSSLATAAAMGKIAIPEMMRYRYDPALAAGSLAAAGTIGALIPPSIIMILYGIFAAVPISHLFFGGLVIGLITAAVYIAIIVIRVTLNPSLAEPVREPFNRAEKLAALRETAPVLLLVAVVFGGLFGGLFTATEAGGAGAFLSLVIAAVLGRMDWPTLRGALRDTVTTSAALFIIAIGANMLTRFMAMSGTGTFLSDVLLSAGDSRIVLLLIITLIYLVLGMFLEPMGAMLLTLPVVLPAIQGAGIEAVWFGILLLKLLEIGMITPPIGMNVFVIRSVVPPSIGLGTIFRGVTWFLLGDLALVMVMILFPGIVDGPAAWFGL